MNLIKIFSIILISLATSTQAADYCGKKYYARTYAWDQVGNRYCRGAVYPEALKQEVLKSLEVRARGASGLERFAQGCLKAGGKPTEVTLDQALFDVSWFEHIDHERYPHGSTYTCDLNAKVRVKRECTCD